jgi:hypothetical protein
MSEQKLTILAIGGHVGDAEPEETKRLLQGQL